MCGIVGHLGPNSPMDTVLEGLSRLEYRGYDSAGIAYVDDKSELHFYKKEGKLQNLVDLLGKEKHTAVGAIGHTRWATHGKVTLENTHPHYSNNGRFFIVHNGIIENYMTLKTELEKKYTFYSETDTEVIAKLVEDLFDGDITTTLEKVTNKLVGAYAIAVIDSQEPDTLVGAKL